MGKDNGKDSGFTGIPGEPAWSPYGYDSIEDTGREALTVAKYTPNESNRRVQEVLSRTLDGGDVDKVRAILKSARRTRRAVMAGNDSGFVNAEDIDPNSTTDSDIAEITNGPTRKPKRTRRDLFDTTKFSEPTSKGHYSGINSPTRRPSFRRPGR